MTEHPESSGDSFTPPAAAPPPAGPPPNPYSYPPGPPPGPYSGYPPPPMPYGDYYASAPVAMRNGLGVAALITGILALPAVCTGLFGLPLGIAAVIFGLFGRNRAKKGQANNGGIATAGIVLGVLAIVLNIFLVIWLYKGADVPQFFDCLSKAGNDPMQTDLCTSDLEDRLSGLFGQPTPIR